MIIGLDLGISSTKVVAFVAKKLNKAEIFEKLNNLYGVNFILAKQSTHMTAIGAAIKAL